MALAPRTVRGSGRPCIIIMQIISGGEGEVISSIGSNTKELTHRSAWFAHRGLQPSGNSSTPRHGWMGGHVGGWGVR